jgi:hypothetical protein
MSLLNKEKQAKTSRQSVQYKQNFTRVHILSLKFLSLEVISSVNKKPEVHFVTSSYSKTNPVSSDPRAFDSKGPEAKAADRFPFVRMIEKKAKTLFDNFSFVDLFIDLSFCKKLTWFHCLQISAKCSTWFCRRRTSSSQEVQELESPTFCTASRIF